MSNADVSSEALAALRERLDEHGGPLANDVALIITALEARCDEAERLLTEYLQAAKKMESERDAALVKVEKLSGLVLSAAAYIEDISSDKSKANAFRDAMEAALAEVKS